MSYFLQEHEYLRNCVAKMVALKPNILVVEKTVARLAQDFLLANDITVVLNVKPVSLISVSFFRTTSDETFTNYLVLEKIED